MEEGNHHIRIRALLLVAAQLAAACFVMVRYELDLARTLGWDLLWTIPAFVVHALLPLSWRRPFLLAVTALLLSRVLGLTAAVHVAWSGLFLVGLCHLPVAFRWRVLAVILSASALALAQAKAIPAGHHLELALPILGGIFMFRLALYLREIRHEAPGAAGPLERIGYFFLLPAPLSPFFPTLDYQVYRKSYYRKPAFETYQTGILWISRGVVQLALYRVIYHFFSPGPEQVADLAGVAAFCLSGYLIYLRVSGLFHVLSGAMRLFGHDLPETHRLYFFARDFSDYWRRINIYWKEFMTKMVFYPAFTALRRSGLGHQGRLAAATLAVFLATALLHAYQTFWLRGSFQIHQADCLFWGVLGLLVVANNLLDARRGQRRPEAPGWSWGQAAGNSVRAVGLFLLFALLWALWSSQEWGVFADVMRQARHAPAWQAGLLAGLAAAAVLLGVAGQWLAWRGLDLFEERPGPLRSVATSALPLLALGLLWQVHAGPGLPGWWGRTFEVVWIDRPNTRDEVARERSYYEALMAGTTASGAADEAKVKQAVTDVRGVIYRPNFGPAEIWGAQWSTNRWGMRDRYCSKAKSPGCYRVAITGASYVAGRGVRDGAAFESVLEDRLNARGQWAEVLNFGNSASGTVQRLADLELRILDFHPDAVFMVCHRGEIDRNLRSLARLISEGSCELTYPYLEELCEKAGASRGGHQAEIHRALAPYGEELTRWSLQRFAGACRERGITPAWVYLPHTDEPDTSGAAECLSIAEEAGMVTIVLDDAYGGLPPREVALSEADLHPNEKGHQLIAGKLYQCLLERRAEIGLPDARLHPN